MPSDIKLFQNSEDLSWDIDFENGDFALTDGLDTALYMSILGEQRATPDQIADPRRRRGHFSNVFASQPGYEIGCHFWVYTEQAILNEETLAALEQTISNDGLQWMVDDAIIDSVEISISVSNSTIQIQANLKSLTLQDSQYYNVFVNTFR